MNNLYCVNHSYFTQFYQNLSFIILISLKIDFIKIQKNFININQANYRLKKSKKHAGKSKESSHEHHKTIIVQIQYNLP